MLADARRAALATILASAAIVLASACADKALSPTSARSPRITLSLRTTFAAQNAPTARYIDVRAGYDRNSGEHITLAEDRIDVAGATQQISLAVNLAGCLADPNRTGDRDACPLRVAVALRDTGAIALDSLELGPFTARPGEPPQVPQVDLAIQRFAVRSWAADYALMPGGPAGPVTPRALTGIVPPGGGDPILYTTVSSPATSSGSGISIFENGSWRTVPIGPLDVTFADLALSSPSEAWLTVPTGAGKGLYRFDGTSVTRIAAIDDSLTTVSAVANAQPRLVFAAGPNGNVWRGDGTTWTRDSLGSPVTEVCVTAPNEAFVTRLDGSIWRWDGTQWSFTASAGGARMLTCPRPGQAFALSATGATMQWNGTAWSTASPVGIPVSTNVFMGAASPTEIYYWNLTQTAATHRVWYRSNGSTGQEVTRAAFGQAITSTWVDPRGGRAYALHGFARMERYESAVNRRTMLTYVPSTRDMIVTSPTSAFAVGWNLVLARWNGTQWFVDPPPPLTPCIRILQGVWSDGPSNAWTVGNASTILRWDGTQWSVVSDVFTPIAGSDSYNAVWGSGSTVLIAGQTTVLRCSGPSACAVDAVPGSGSLLGIWGTSLSNVLAVGVGGRIVRHDGNTWTQMTSPTTRTLSRVWGSSATNVWAVGDSVLLRFDGTSWATVPMTGELTDMQSAVPGAGTQPHQIGLWGSGPNDVYVGSTSGRIARFDGTAWRQMPTSNARRVVAISGVASVGAMALFAGESSAMGPLLMRGVGPTGVFSAPAIPPTIWP